MSEKDKASEANKDVESRSPQVGALLRASRLRLGEDLREISDVLCIRYLYLEAIEECSYGDLPGDTYAVGFIRSYAEHMGLDGEEVVRRFRAEQTGYRRANDLSFPTPVPDSGVPKGAIVFVGVVLALLVYGGWYVTTTDEDILSDLISPVPDHLKHLVTGDDENAGDTPDASLSEPAPEKMPNVTEEQTGSTDTTVPKPAPPAEDTAPTESADAPAEPAAEMPGAASDDTSSLQSTGETIASEAEQVAETVNESVAESATDAAEAAAPAAEAVRETVEETASATRETVETAAQEVSEAVTGTTSNANQQTPSADETASTTEAAAASGSETPATPAADETAAAPETPSEEPAATATAPPNADALNQESLQRASGDQAAEPTPAAPAPSASEAEAPAETASTAPASAAPSVSASGIVIRATDSSWVEVRDSEGNVVFTGLMSAGSTYDVPDTDGLVMDTGNAGALNITVEGASVPKLGDVGTVRKGVALDADRLRAGTAADR